MKARSGFRTRPVDTTSRTIEIAGLGQILTIDQTVDAAMAAS
jgi:hypothetical protein